VALALLLCWHRCHRCLGIVAVTALASSRLSRWTLSPSWRWHHCCRRDGAVSPLRRCRHCWGQPGACAIVGVVTLASSLPLPWCSCHHCSCGAGVLADISMAPLPPSLWNCCHHCAGIIVALALLPLLLGHCCRRGVGVLAVVAMYIVAVLALAPSPVVVLAPLCHCQRGDTGVIPRVALGQLPLLQLRRWHPCRHRDGVVASVTLELLSLLRWRHRRAGTIAIVAWALSTSRCWRPRDCCNVHCCRLGAGVIAVVAMAPLLLSRQCHHRRRQPGACAIVDVMTLAPLLSSPWRHCHHCRCGAGVLADIVMAPLPAHLSGIAVVALTL
jgi:hypothetical protein